jgi:hypothetical protein
MGFPRLTAFLRPYGEQITFTADRTNDTTRVVIDGPAFAHHVYNLCVQESDASGRTSQGYLSYGSIGERAVTWLRDLQKHSIVMYAFYLIFFANASLALPVNLGLHNMASDKIYFDGFLPASKEKTRMSRMENFVTKLAYVRSGHGVPVEQREQLSKRQLKDLSPRGLLVPAVLDALDQDVAFSPKTLVVPHEADVCCAQDVRVNGGVVVTNDSDLLVHDLGPSGSVIFLNDIQFPKVTDEDQTLQCLHMVPREIAQQLGLESLIPLANAIRLGDSLNQAVQRAKCISTESSSYREFAQPFQELLVPSAFERTLGHEQTQHPVLIVLKRLDPQVSEFVHQHTTTLLCQIDGGLGSSKSAFKEVARNYSTKTTLMYLPSMLEDCSKSSTWAIGLNTRSIGYSLLIANASNHAVFEVLRRQTELHQKPIELFQGSELLEQCKTLVSQLQQHFAQWPHLPCNYGLVWRLWGLRLICENAAKRNQQIPAKSSMVQLLKFRYLERTPWRAIHLRAYMEAALYSLRILRQFLEVCFAAPIQQTLESKLLTTLDTLYSRLRTLPPLAGLLDTDPRTLGLDDGRLDRMVDQLYQSLNLNAASEPPEWGKQKKSKKARMKSSTINVNCPAVSVQNPYSLLEN